MEPFAYIELFLGGWLIYLGWLVLDSHDCARTALVDFSGYSLL